MDDWRAAADEHGVLAHPELRAAGLSSTDIDHLVRAAQLTSLARGWYALGVPETPERRHVLTTYAMLRAHEDRAVASHHSALLLLGLPTYRADLTRVRLARRNSGSPRTRVGQSLGRVVPIEAQGAQTVVPALAVVQHGLSSGPLSALVAADAALHSRKADAHDLQGALDWTKRHPGAAMVHAFLELADGRRESPGETRLAHLLHLMKVQATPQVEVTASDFRAIVDFMIDGEMVILEFDGQVKYGRYGDHTDPFGNRRPPQEVLWAEKRREDRLRELGYEVVRVTWSDLDDPPMLARRIAEAIRRARTRRVSRSA